jgi:hypothetical protein
MYYYPMVGLDILNLAFNANDQELNTHQKWLRNLHPVLKSGALLAEFADRAWDSE